MCFVQCKHESLAISLNKWLLFVFLFYWLFSPKIGCMYNRKVHKPFLPRYSFIYGCVKKHRIFNHHVVQFQAWTTLRLKYLYPICITAFILVDLCQCREMLMKFPSIGKVSVSNSTHTYTYESLLEALEFCECNWGQNLVSSSQVTYPRLLTEFYRVEIKT